MKNVVKYLIGVVLFVLWCVILLMSSYPIFLTVQYVLFGIVQEHFKDRTMVDILIGVPLAVIVAFITSIFNAFVDWD